METYYFGAFSLKTPIHAPPNWGLGEYVGHRGLEKGGFRVWMDECGRKMDDCQRKIGQIKTDDKLFEYL